MYLYISPQNKLCSNPKPVLIMENCDKKWSSTLDHAYTEAFTKYACFIKKCVIHFCPPSMWNPGHCAQSRFGIKSTSWFSPSVNY